MQNIDVVKKSEVEELLGCEITDEQFEEALGYARRKQEYIYQRESIYGLGRRKQAGEPCYCKYRARERAQEKANAG